MRIPLDPDARVFVAAPLAGALVLAGLAHWGGFPALFGLAGLLAAAAVFCVFFFRDPERVPDGGEDAVLAPADGRVTDAAPVAPGGELRVSIFLSVFNVHVNRSPVAGTVSALRYRKGEFRAAFRKDAAQRNESNELVLTTPHGDVTVRQIVGVLARRIVCRVRRGDRLERGQRFGLMRFGSRTDVILPPGFSLAVRPGDRVRGGKTVIARLTAEP